LSKGSAWRRFGLDRHDHRFGISFLGVDAFYGSLRRCRSFVTVNSGRQMSAI
jgi:hypothetical protein